MDTKGEHCGLVKDDTAHRMDPTTRYLRFSGLTAGLQFF